MTPSPSWMIFIENCHRERTLLTFQQNGSDSAQARSCFTAAGRSGRKVFQSFRDFQFVHVWLFLFIHCQQRPRVASCRPLCCMIDWYGTRMKKTKGYLSSTFPHFSDEWWSRLLDYRGNVRKEVIRYFYGFDIQTVVPSEKVYLSVIQINLMCTEIY